MLSSRKIFYIWQVHFEILVNGILQHLSVANMLLYIYVQHKLVGDGYGLFSVMGETSAVSWRLMVDGFV